MMEILNPRISLDRFFRDLASAPSRLLISDYDGTLAPFCIDRDRAVPYPGIVERLAEVMKDKRNHVIIVSGRSVADLIPLLGLDPLPEIWGSHGAERLSAKGGYQRIEPDGETIRKLNEIDTWARQRNLIPFLEKKPLGRAFHWRGVKPAKRAELRAGLDQLKSLCTDTGGLTALEFDGGVEFRLAGADKGKAVEQILQTVPDETAVAYLGDDLTDEDAFRVLGRRGLRLIVGSADRPTAADLRLSAPDELLQFLDRWPSAGRGPQGGPHKK